MQKKILKKKIVISIIITISMLISILNVFIPTYIGKIIDEILENSIDKVIKSLIILLEVYALTYTMSFIQNIFLSKYTVSIQKEIRKELLEKINNIQLKKLDEMELGDILNRFSIDIENISIGLLKGIPKVVSSIIIVILSSIIMIKINIYLALTLIMIAPIVYLISNFITKRTNKFFKDKAEIVAKLNNQAEEFITFQETVKDFNYDKKAISKFEEINKDSYRIGVKSQFYSALTNPVTRLVSNLTYITIGIFGIILMQQNYITLGNISSFLLYTNIFTRPFNEITSILLELQSAKISIDRIRNFLEEDEEQNEGNMLMKFDKSIEFKNIEFSYSEKTVIKNFNLSVKKGEKIAIVGRTGAGKTTILNILLRFYDIQKGEILIDEKNIKNIELKELRKDIGIVLQNSKIFYGTVKENIAYGLGKIKEEKIIQVAKLTKADTFIEKLPNKYETIINNENLSEGEIQLITIARAMLRNPKILILDEATSNIDLVTENKIQKSIIELMKGKTTFIIAHRLSTIKNADKIIYLENGNILELGTHEELMNKKGKYYQMYITQ